MQTYLAWQENLILTTVNTTGLPIRHVTFPAITICGLGSVDSVMADMLWNQVSDIREDEGVAFPFSKVAEGRFPSTHC